MRIQHRHKESGLIKTATYLALIAIIAVKVLRAVVMTLANAYNTVADNRHSRR
jgi:hypothetical protein